MSQTRVRRALSTSTTTIAGRLATEKDGNAPCWRHAEDTPRPLGGRWPRLALLHRHALRRLVLSRWTSAQSRIACAPALRGELSVGADECRWHLRIHLQPLSC